MFADIQTSNARYNATDVAEEDWSQDPTEALSQRANRILALMRSGRQNAAQRDVKVKRNGDVTFTRNGETKRLNRCIEAIRQELDNSYYTQNFETGGLPAFQVPVTLSFGRGIAQRLSFEWEVNFEQKLKKDSYQPEPESFEPTRLQFQSSDARSTANLPALGVHEAFTSDDFTTGGWTTWATQETIVLTTKDKASQAAEAMPPKTNIVVNFEPKEQTEQTKNETSFFTDLPAVPSKKHRIPPAKAIYHSPAFKGVPSEGETETATSFKCLKVDTERLAQMICTVRERRVTRLSARAAQLCDERDARGDEFANLTAIETLKRFWVKFETFFWDVQRCSSALLSRSRNSR